MKDGGQLFKIKFRVAGKHGKGNTVGMSARNQRFKNTGRIHTHAFRNMRCRKVIDINGIAVQGIGNAELVQRACGIGFLDGRHTYSIQMRPFFQRNGFGDAYLLTTNGQKVQRLGEGEDISIHKKRKTR